jgi:hypothetical protein
VISEPCRLDHDDGGRESGDQSVAAGEIAGARLPAELHFGDECALLQNGVGERGVLGRIDAVVAAGEHGDGAGGEAAPVCRGVDAARQAGCNREPRFAELARQPLGEAHARGRGIARADDRHGRQGERSGVAAHGEKRRGIVDHPQAVRIVGLGSRHQGHAHRLGGRELALGVLARADAGRPGCAPSSGEIGQRGQRRARIAAMPDQGLKRARADMIAADQPQPIDPLLVG